VAAKSYRQVACFLTPEQHDGLKRLSRETHIPMQVFLRKAVDDALARYGIKCKGNGSKDDFLDRGLINLRKGTKR
jgi:Ribbon-helix-helix domain